MQAVTVDHGLRPEAAAEARRVAALCATRSIAHRTLVWSGPKPATGTIAAAREARYDLLAQAAADFGADCVLVGHTLDDQAETVAMRAQRGSGSGLAGMAPSTLFDGRAWIVRPLLTIRREALREDLRAAGLDWIDDPSNANPRYERVRMRARLAGGDTVETLGRQAQAAGAARRRLSGAAAALLAQHLTMPSAGLLRLGRGFFDADIDIATLGLRAVLACAGGTPYLPDAERTQTLARRIAGGEIARVSLSRAVTDARKHDAWIWREARGVPDAPIGTAASVWDGRWRFSARRDGLRVMPLGQARAAGLVADLPGTPQSLALAALRQEPAVHDDEDFIGLATAGDAGAAPVEARRIVAPFARFLPDFDLDLAAALARVLDAAPPPPSPWKHHNGTGA